MDVVYDASQYSVGLLNTALMHQQEVDTLWELLSLSTFQNPKNRKAARLKTKFNPLETQMLILRLLSDVRWSRGWIFQEDHLSSDRMILLIPHSKHLKKEDYFGSIPGELQVNLAHFRQPVTLFCMASGDARRWPNSEILGKTKQYNIWNRIDTAWNQSDTGRSLPNMLHLHNMWLICNMRRNVWTMLCRCIPARRSVFWKTYAIAISSKKKIESQSWQTRLDTPYAWTLLRLLLFSKTTLTASPLFCSPSSC